MHLVTAAILDEKHLSPARTAEVLQKLNLQGLNIKDVLRYQLVKTALTKKTRKHYCICMLAKV